MHIVGEELALVRAESRSLVEQRRVKVRKPITGRPRGRPIRHSGTYYTRHILISDRLWLIAHQIRMPNEPLGAALERYVGIAGQKRIEESSSIETFKAPEMENDNLFKRIWDHYDK